MTRFQGSSIVLFFALLSGCGGSGPVNPGDIDTDPPHWVSGVGITSVVQTDDGVMVSWGTATDTLNPPVDYLIYVDTDDVPWDVKPGRISGATTHTLKYLNFGDEYTIGVRCRDSASPPNIDDNTRVLKITPQARGWVRLTGGAGNEYNWKVDADSLGNVYVAGAFQDTVDVDPSEAVDTRKSTGDWDMYLAKFNPDGGLVWARTWGDVGWDWCRSVHVGNDSRIYVVGEFTGAVAFEFGVNPIIHWSNGQWDAFLTVFDQDGNYVFSKSWGGESWDEALDVVTDPDGNIYVAGSLAGDVDLDPGDGVDLVHGNDLPDAFLSKFDSSGNYISGCHFGSEGWDWATGVDVDSQSNVFLTGSFTSSIDFDPGPDTSTMIANGSWDAFLVSLDSGGNFIWSKSWGGNLWDEALEISIDDSGNACVVGFFEDIVDFDPGPGIDSQGVPGTRSAYVSAFDPSGNHDWTASWEVGQKNYAYGLDRDTAGNIYVVGFFAGTTDFDYGPGTSLGRALGKSDIYLLKYDNSGGFVWSRSWGGFADDYGLGVAVSDDGKIYTCGAIGGPADMDPGYGISTRTTAGGFDSWVMMMPDTGLW